jgi:hypothetical protein
MTKTIPAMKEIDIVGNGFDYNSDADEEGDCDSTYGK